VKEHELVAMTKLTMEPRVISPMHVKKSKGEHELVAMTKLTMEPRVISSMHMDNACRKATRKLDISR
jgi:hypothetical protein